MATAYRDSATRPSPQTTLGEKKGVHFFAKKNWGKIFCPLERKLLYTCAQIQSSTKEITFPF